MIIDDFKPTVKLISRSVPTDDFIKEWQEVNGDNSVPDAENLITYVARVSNTSNQTSDSKGLISYCIKHGHWSVLEHSFLTFEVVAPLNIITQLLRHTFKFQQFSGRYAKHTDLFVPELRFQDVKNRQNSIEIDDEVAKEEAEEYKEKIKEYLQKGSSLYNELIDAGYAKEVSRFVLPQAMISKCYVSGNVRTFFHYCKLRTANGTQKEHVQVASAIADIFKQEFPLVGSFLDDSVC